MKLLRNLSLMSFGATAMYFLDPRLGPRRRAVLRDRSRSAVQRLLHATGRMRRDLSHRSRGIFHKIGNRIQSGRQDVPDSILEARIRSSIGRHLRGHPHTFDVLVNEGNVLLEGEISDALYQRIQPVIRRMPGVFSVKRLAKAAARAA